MNVSTINKQGNGNTQMCKSFILKNNGKSIFITITILITNHRTIHYLLLTLFVRLMALCYFKIGFSIFYHNG